MKRSVAGSAEKLARHPIAVVAARTGLSQDVLRVWERRYGAVAPVRSDDGQRLYSDADVDRLRRLRLATSAGRSISQVVQLSERELAKLVDEDSEARVAEPRLHDVDDREAVESVEQAMSFTRALDAAGLDNVLRRSAAVLGLSAFLEQVAAVLLRTVGDEWHAGRVTRAQEHLASSVVQHFIIGAMRDLTPAADARTVVVATPAGERHAIGAALIGAWAAASGWRVVYLGADLPAIDIATSAIAVDANVVALSVVFVSDIKLLMSEIRELRSQLPDGITIVAGGGGATALEKELEKLGVRAATRLSDLEGNLR